MSDAQRAEGYIRMAEAHQAGGNLDEARQTCETGLSMVPGHPGLVALLAGLPPGGGANAGSVQYRVEKPVTLTPSLDPAVAGGSELAVGLLVLVSDVVVFKGVTRMKARVVSPPTGESGWLDFGLAGASGRPNVVQHPHHARDNRPSAAQAQRDCYMGGVLQKRGTFKWNKRFFVIAPQKLSPASPDQFLYYYESPSSDAPKDVIKLEMCRATEHHDGKPHCLNIACGQQRDGPDHYLVAADSAAEIEAWKKMLDKLTAGLSSVPPEFADGGAPPPPIGQPEPEPEAVAPPPVSLRRLSWALNPALAPGAGGAAAADAAPPVKPPSCGFDYSFAVEKGILEDIQRREEERIAQLERERAEAEAREAQLAADAAEAAEQERLAEERAENLRTEREEAERARIERERIEREEAEAAELEAKSVGKWLAETCGVGFEEGGGAGFRALYEGGFQEHHIQEYEQLKSMPQDAFGILVDQIVPADRAEHRQLIRAPLEALWAAEEAERLRIEQIERDRVAAEEAEARRVEAEAQRVAEAQQALLAAQEAERQEREAAAELERARLQAEEVERARVQKLRQKIKNMEDTNTFLRTQAGTDMAIASNMQDIARLQAEIQGQPAGAPPAYDAPVVPAPSPSPSPSVPAYQPPGGPPPPTYVAPVVATPAPAPLTSLETTARMLGIEQVNAAGSIGLSADMLQRRLQSQFGFSQFTANDLVRVVGAQPHPHPLAYPLPR